MREEMGASCSRFKSPLDWENRMDSRISSALEKIDPLASMSGQIVGGLPLQWKRLVGFLHAQGISLYDDFEFLHAINDMPKRFHVRLHGTPLDEKTDGRKIKVLGQGMSSSVETALSKSVGELLERYFLAVYRKENLKIASLAEMQKTGNLFDVRHLSGFLPWQSEARRAFVRDGDVPLYWQKGRDAVSGTSAYIPAQLVFWGYDSVPENGRRLLLQESNTNGAAGGFTYEEAFVSAVLELVQRDGFLMYWLNTISPKRIDLSSLSDEGVSNALEELKYYGVECHILDTTSDIGVFSCACVLVDRRGEPIVAVGGGASFQVADAIEQSINEAISVLGFLAHIDPYELPSPYAPFSTPIGRFERLRVWRGEKMLKHLDFFIGGEIVPVGNIVGADDGELSAAEQYAKILDIFRKKGRGYEIFAHEVQNNLLRELGYHVVRTVVPALMPLYLTEHYAPLGCARLSDFAHMQKQTATLNTMPHPFP